MKNLFIVLFFFFPVLAIADQDNGPLRVQMESKYVTDQSIWGQLIYQKNRNLNEQEKEIEKLIKTYHKSWLDRDNDQLSKILDDNIIRFRSGFKTHGLKDTLRGIVSESRGERPSGFKSSIQMTIGDVIINVEDEFASSVYAIGIRGGARWEYSDLLTVSQLYHQINGKWKIIGHFESAKLENNNIESPPESVPNRIKPFTFDFVYPVTDLERAIEFYSGLIGAPHIVTPTTASFKFRNSYFELNSKPPDERIKVIHGETNGYGVIHVKSLDKLIGELEDQMTIDSRVTSCNKGKCLVTNDESGNIIVWKEAQTTNDPTFKNPTISFISQLSADPVHSKVIDVMRAWAAIDVDKVTEMQLQNATWIDDAYNLARGRKDIANAIEARWKNYDQSINGINADLIMSNFKQYSFGNRTLVTFEIEVNVRSNMKKNFNAFVSQLWINEDDDLQLENTFIGESRLPKNRQVSSMDYTAYPVNDLGVAGRFYKNLLKSEPYRDDNWFGFWSTESVFGLVGPLGAVPWEPTMDKSNGYADLTIRSANKVYDYLKNYGSSFPLIEAINNTAGIDTQPGYKQILSTDSEGNLINFSEYLEY